MAKKSGGATRPAKSRSVPLHEVNSAKPALGSGAAKEAELDRLRSEERTLVLDSKNETVRSTMPQSAEYIAAAMTDSLAEELGEASVEAATSGDHAAENIRDEDFAEEVGGPFVQTSARQEFAGGTDASNPVDAEPAPFPMANARRPQK